MPVSFAASDTRAWGDQLDRAFVRLEPHRAVADFGGRIDQVDVGPYRIARVSASGHTVSRRRAHLADNCGEYFMNLQLSGHGVLDDRVRRTPVRPLDVAVIDTAAPFDLEHAGAFDLVCITVPRSQMPELDASRGVLALSRSARAREVSAILLSSVRLALALDGAADTAMGAAVERQLGSALRLATAAATSGSPDAVDPDLIASVVERHLRDPELSVAWIAQHLDLSVRQVQRIWETVAELPLSAHIIERRMQQAAVALLADPAAPVCQIAQHHGFSDADYFRRRFKHRFGITPTQHRMHLANG